MSTQELIRELQRLPFNKRMMIIKKLTEGTRQPTSKKLKLSSISGVGAILWKNIDIDEYIRSER